MDLKQIKQIIDLMKRSELTEFAVEEEGFKLKIRRGTNGIPVISAGGGTVSPFSIGDTNPPLPLPSGTSATSPGTGSAAKDEAGFCFIKSPMVGTFYRAASPESKPFADVGSKVVENTVVCIIEAMKIMNEIEADETGTIAKILCENGQAVEFGQPLFVIDRRG